MSKPLNILQIGKFYPPFRGGMERALKELSEGLVESGHRVSCLVSNTKFQSEHSVINGVDIFRQPTLGQMLSTPLTLWSKSLIEEINPDIVHIHIPNPLPMFLKPYIKCPIVVTHHADPAKGGWLDKAYQKQLIKFLDGVGGAIFSSKKNQLISPIPYEKLSLKTKAIPFGIAPTPKPDNSKVSKHIKSLTPDALFVGRLVGYKGLKHLINSFISVEGRLVIVGDGPERESLEFLVSSRKLQDRVTFTGELNNRDRNYLIHKTKLMVQPSINEQETFGISLLEGLSAGKPLVSTSLRSGVTDVNRHQITGLVARPGSIRELSYAINQILSEPELRRIFSLQAREHFEKNFTRKKMIDSHITFYQECINHSSEKHSSAQPPSETHLKKDIAL